MYSRNKKRTNKILFTIFRYFQTNSLYLGYGKKEGNCCSLKPYTKGMNEMVNYIYSDLIEKGVTIQLIDGTIVIGTMETCVKNPFTHRWQYIPQY